MTRCGIAACLACWFISGAPGLVPARAEELPSGKAEVSADKLTVLHQEQRATFEGHVRARFGAVSLVCDALEVTYDAAGGAQSVLARGHVEVAREGARATAGTARLDARQKLLVLEQQPVLTQGGQRLTGVRITVALETGRVEVTSARGSFTFGAQGALP